MSTRAINRIAILSLESFYPKNFGITCCQVKLITVFTLIKAQGLYFSKGRFGWVYSGGELQLELIRYTTIEEIRLLKIIALWSSGLLPNILFHDILIIFTLLFPYHFCILSLKEFLIFFSIIEK